MVEKDVMNAVIALESRVVSIETDLRRRIIQLESETAYLERHVENLEKRELRFA